MSTGNGTQSAQIVLFLGNGSKIIGRTERERDKERKRKRERRECVRDEFQIASLKPLLSFY